MERKYGYEKKNAYLLFYCFFTSVVINEIIALIEEDFDVLVAFLFPTALAPMLSKAINK